MSTELCFFYQIKSKLYEGKYENEIDFRKDMCQIWINAKEFHSKKDFLITVWAQILENLFNVEMNKRYSKPYREQEDNELSDSDIISDVEDENPPRGSKFFK